MGTRNTELHVRDQSDCGAINGILVYNVTGRLQHRSETLRDERFVLDSLPSRCMSSHRSATLLLLYLSCYALDSLVAVSHPHTLHIAFIYHTPRIQFGFLHGTEKRVTGTVYFMNITQVQTPLPA